MKSLNLNTTQTLLALALAVSASSAFAGGPSFDSGRVLTEKNTAMEGAAIAINRLPCSNPTTLTINSPTSGPAAYDPQDFPAQHAAGLTSIFHQTTANKQFDYTFKFKMPEGCCEVAPGKLTVYYRAVQGGSSSTAADAGNDLGSLVRNGVGQPGGGAIYSSFPFAAGTQTVRTYTVPAGWIASGRVSFGVEDDTAVDHMTLTAQMCCVHDTPATP